MIPKRPKQKASFYRSREYKKELRLKFFKWSHFKAAKVFFSKFSTRYNPYAVDWFEQDRTVVMQARADAMFDSMYTMLQIRVEQVPKKTMEKVMKRVLLEWAHIQRADGRDYVVKEDYIVPK